MVDVNVKTVRLTAGAHLAPADGVCTMELCSMLAGERFSDRPHCACPLLAAFARGYNDALDDVRRQELTTLALILVGSRTDDAAWRRERAGRLFAHAATMPPLVGRPSRWRAHGLTGQLAQAGARSAQAVRRDAAAHDRTLALLRELAEPSRTGAGVPDAPPSQAPAAAALGLS
ncbi:hypothetical protein DSM112329_02538 [Paraconexibacter sp. AEG42_29]|uniref:Uncharacterized protein n=1 Tax=Paraconexibacter sp. AEG42_29 TaxID=2997339 RepID=A0AAU7AVL1_9ACTN